MRIEHIDDRLIRHRSDFRQNIVVVSVEHVVDENHASTRDVHGHVAAFARNHVEVAFDGRDLQRQRGFERLRVHRRDDLSEAERENGRGCRKGACHEALRGLRAGGSTILLDEPIGALLYDEEGGATSDPPGECPKLARLAGLLPKPPERHHRQMLFRPSLACDIFQLSEGRR